MPNSSLPTQPQNFALSPLAAAISFAIAATTPVIGQAQTTTESSQSEPRQLSKLVAKDDAETIKADQVASPKFTQPLIDTPQTITVVTQETLRQQGASTLMEALANTPGITMQLGENGNTSAGDTFYMRGVASESNIFADGIRDSGATTRDTFNTEQVEIAKGPAGSDYGRGATSGYINQVSKLPRADDFGSASMSFGSAKNIRATSDLNKQLSDSSALRFNAMWQNGGVAGRDLVENNSWGVAPSVGFGINTTTKLYLSAQVVRQDNVPDGGVPTIGLPGFYNAAFVSGVNAGITPAKADTKSFYGRYDDYEKMSSDVGTLQIEHEFGNGMKLSNTSRYSRNETERMLTTPTGAGTPGYAVSNTNPAFWAIGLSRQGTARDNATTTNQTNLTLNFKTGFIEHSASTGAEYIKETQVSPKDSPQYYTSVGVLSGVLATTATTTMVFTNSTYIYNPNPYMSYSTAPNTIPNGTYSRGSNQTLAAYVFDTLKLSEQWLINGSARFERYNTDYNSMATSGVLSQFNAKGNLFSWRAGVVFKPVAIGSIYATYANSLTPPGSANFQLSASNSTQSSNPNADPQEATNIEVGTKWDLLNKKLGVNLAAYRSEKKNEIVTVDTATQEVGSYGKSRYEGVELSLVGSITNAWQLTGGVAYTKTKVTEGSATTTGQTTRWSPPLTATLWSTYQITPKLQVGGGANYVDEQKRELSLTANLAASTVAVIPSYWVANAMTSYNLNDYVGLQLNVYNLFDKEYIARLNNSGYRYNPGAPRSAKLTANFKF
ncbi:MAG: catecholate siderophore receptor Fiu [Steroidobacteraceae bacterium]